MKTKKFLIILGTGLLGMSLTIYGQFPHILLCDPELYEIACSANLDASYQVLRYGMLIGVILVGVGLFLWSGQQPSRSPTLIRK